MVRCIIEISSFSFLSPKHLPGHGSIGNTDQDIFIFNQRNVGAEERNTVNVVVGAVKRVNYPGVTAGVSGGVGFFGEDFVIRIFLF